ncbi:MAG: hypothetical protein WC551_03895 [Patescibacteria group bacterium]
MDNTKQSKTTYVLIGVLFTFIALLALFTILQLRSRADITEQTASTENSPPWPDETIVSDVSRGDPITEFTPVEGGTRTIYVHGTVSDQNGCTDIKSIDVAVYRSSVSVDPETICATDKNNCYKATLQPADFDPGCAEGVTTVTFEKSFDLENYVDPTDAGSPYKREDWTAFVGVHDAEAYAPFDTRSFEMNSLAAFSVPDAINYGSVSLGQDSNKISLAFSNTGNREVDSNVIAFVDLVHQPNPIPGDMTSNLTGFSDIAASATHYSLDSDFVYGTGDTAVSKTASTDLPLNLAQQTEDNTVPTVDSYWRMRVPSSGVNGTYSNTLVFTAKVTPGAPFVEVINWGETQPAGDVGKSWATLASDSSGLKLITATPFSGRVYTSTNGGTSWTETQPAGDIDKGWNSVASDSDGTNLIAAASWGTGGGIWVTNNSGSSWSEKQPNGGPGNWSVVASDADGSTLMAGFTRLYTSSDSGASWTERRPAGDVDDNWRALASNADGSHLVAGSINGKIYVSDDGGVSWTDTTPAGNNDNAWTMIASDSTGDKILAASLRLYQSTDGGLNWTETQPDGDADRQWNGVASSADGLHLLAGEYLGYLFYSDDGGATWNETRPAGESEYVWGGMAVNSDGTRMAAGIWTSDGRLYTGTPVSP